MKSIGEFYIDCQTAAFAFEIFEDSEHSDFLGTISDHRPPGFPRVEPGHPLRQTALLPDQEVRDKDEGHLILLCKQRMESLGGHIVFVMRY